MQRERRMCSEVRRHNDRSQQSSFNVVGLYEGSLRFVDNVGEFIAFDVTMINPLKT